MKRIIVALMTGLVLSASIPSVAQKHRHTPMTSVSVSSETDKTGNTKKTAAIVAYSDTTGGFDADSLAEDSLYDDGTYGWDKPYDLHEMGKIMEGALMPIAIVFILFFLAPVIILGLILYFIIKSRKQKIRLAELALQNGQPIPESIVKQVAPKNEELWTKGIKKMFIGAGLVVFAMFMSSTTLAGIGFFVAIYGCGQAFIAWTTKKNKEKDETLYSDAHKEEYEDIPEKDTEE